MLRIEATGRDAEFWRLGPDDDIQLQLAADEVAAIFGDDHPRLVVVLNGRIDLDAERSLRECQWFRVESTSGEQVGVVSEVRVDPPSERVIKLDVCHGWFGRRHLTLERGDVVAILPSAERLLVGRPAEGFRLLQRRRP